MTQTQLDNLVTEIIATLRKYHQFNQAAKQTWPNELHDIKTEIKELIRKATHNNV